jgi:Transposase IS66 family/Family of unknown function (DUF6444)/zinc-finger binding domain of transposase IS66
MEREARVPATLEEALGLLRAVWEAAERWQAEAAELRAANAVLTQRVAELEARLKQNSTNSSRPPSSDPPGTPAPPPRPPSGRRRGAQPGHPAHQRALLPPEQVDQVVAHWPARCRHCQTPLSTASEWLVGEPIRHQVTELPPVRAEVTEHQLHRVRCPDCGGATRASLPPEVPSGAFGPRLQAAVALLSGRYRLSRREVVAVCEDLLGAPLAVGSVDGLCRATASALAEPVAELAAAIRDVPVAHADETGWKQAGQRQWLWVVTTTLLTVFTLAASRGRGVITGLLGEDFGGRLVSDRYSAYGWLPLEQRQVCWAHLRRDFAALLSTAQRGPERGGARTGAAGLAGLDRPDLRRLAASPRGAGHPGGSLAPERDARPAPRGDTRALGGGPAAAGGSTRRLVAESAAGLAGPLDVRPGAGCRADQQRGRAGPPAGGLVAQGQLRHPEPRVTAATSSSPASSRSPRPAANSSARCWRI